MPGSRHASHGSAPPETVYITRQQVVQTVVRTGDTVKEFPDVFLLFSYVFFLFHRFRRQRYCFFPTYAKKIAPKDDFFQCTMYNLQCTKGFWSIVQGSRSVRTHQFVPKSIGRFVNCELLITFTPDAPRLPSFAPHKSSENECS